MSFRKRSGLLNCLNADYKDSPFSIEVIAGELPGTTKNGDSGDCDCVRTSGADYKWLSGTTKKEHTVSMW